MDSYTVGVIGNTVWVGGTPLSMLSTGLQREALLVVRECGKTSLSLFSGEKLVTSVSPMYSDNDVFVRMTRIETLAQPKESTYSFFAYYKGGNRLYQ